MPATSANLGPGYDCLGLALDLRDTLTAEVYDGPLVITVDGEGADEVPLRPEPPGAPGDGVRVRAARRAQPPGLRLHCVNRIPHARGLGSSSAAIVGGIVLARALIEAGADRLDDGAALDLANRMEGHPDNVAPAPARRLHGRHPGRRRTWRLPGWTSTRASRRWRSCRATRCTTSVARGLLPDAVRHADAAANSGRAALLVAAMIGAPDLLLPATADLLHQEYRRPAMPETLALVTALRGDGIPAVLSGAGPSVLALVAPADVDEAARRTPPGWVSLTPAIGVDGARVLPG